MIEHYLAHTPPPDERLEHMLAQHMAHFVSAHSAKGSPAPDPTKYRPWLEAWRAPPMSSEEGESE